VSMDFVELVEQHAKDHHDGHLTILRFTTGWKAAFGTLSDLEDRDRGYVWSIRTAPTLQEACLQLLYRERLLTVYEGLAQWAERVSDRVSEHFGEQKERDG
jgi:hypothetical protein